MKNNILVSIIMPTFNHDKFIKFSIESILNQTYPNLELIIVNDGSTDLTENEIKRFKDKRIKYIYQENQGVRRLNKTINKGLAFCRGDLVTMMPSDDIWPIDRLEKQVMFFKDDNVSLVFGNMTLIDEKNKILKTINIDKNLQNYNSWPWEEKFIKYLKKNYIPQPTVLIRSKKIKEIGGYLQEDYMYAEDYPTQLNLLLNGDFKFINENLAFYRIHSNQMTKNHTKNMLLSDIKYIRNFYFNLNQDIKDKIDFQYSKLRQSLLSNLYESYFDIGRTFLANKNKNSCRKYFFKSIKFSSTITKLKSILGLLASFGFFNLEKFIKFYNYKL